MRDEATPFLVSACLGALVGLIRQWEVQQEGEGDQEFAGLRTFALMSLLGCTLAALSGMGLPALFPTGLGLLGVYLAVSRLHTRPEQGAGYTTFAAMVLTFLVGALVYWGATRAAVVLTGGLVLLLALKRPIHKWTRQFTEQDIRSTLQFVAITGVILPLVPNRDYGPFGAFNPYSTWLMVVLISGLGFVGYLLMRVLGTQAGTSLTGLIGGLASSTATTLAFSRRSHDDPERSNAYALAIILACTVMLARIAFLVAMLNPTLLARAGPTLAFMTLPAWAFAAWTWRAQRQASAPVEPPALTNPLNLSTAVKFALLFALANFLVKAVTELQLTHGVLVVSFVTGLTDADAIVLSMLRNAGLGGLSPELITQAVVVAAVSNTILKAAMAYSLGSPAMRKPVVTTLGATVVLGLIAIWW